MFVVRKSLLAVKVHRLPCERWLGIWHDGGSSKMLASADEVPRDAHHGKASLTSAHISCAMT